MKPEVSEKLPQGLTKSVTEKATALLCLSFSASSPSRFGRAYSGFVIANKRLYTP